MLSARCGQARSATSDNGGHNPAKPQQLPVPDREDDEPKVGTETDIELDGYASTEPLSLARGLVFRTPDPGLGALRIAQRLHRGIDKRLQSPWTRCAEASADGQNVEVSRSHHRLYPSRHKDKA